MATLAPKAGFDWRRVAWGRPDVPPRKLCSYCHTLISEASGPLMLWADDGSAARFCDGCMATWFGLRSV